MSILPTVKASELEGGAAANQSVSLIQTGVVSVPHGLYQQSPSFKELKWSDYEVKQQMKSLLQHDSTKQRKFKHIVVDTLRRLQDFKRSEQSVFETLGERRESH